MPKWTNEQLEAIEKEGTNIIVSAGAGSGKTAVLTARVIRKLEDGVNINQLLVLTFTKAAAHEMKERIRKAISKNFSIQDQLNYIDSSYITTFDSYALSIVKRYHYLLNIAKEVSILDASIIYFEKKKITDIVFEQLYEEKNKEFLKLIGDLCIKDDEDIKKMIISLSEKLDLKYDKESYLNNYIDNNFSDKAIDDIISIYEEQVLNDISKIKYLVEKLEELVDNDYYNSLLESINPLLYASSYDEVVLSLDIKLPALKKGSDEETKALKQELSSNITALKKKLSFDSVKDIKESLYLTKDYIIAIINIIKLIDIRINEFKKVNSSFEFNDISKMAINILKNNEDVRNELKTSFKEIMIDEYQDTNDLQEEFVSMIEDNNVYMVGDIKQSIYRFRNANPYIFKGKYDKYSNSIGGYKIDLNKNFRSRREVLDDINLIFDSLMTDEVGGANYSHSHRMAFGNESYIMEGATEQKQNMDIYRYSYDNSTIYSKEEIEAFFIANDIKSKIESKYKVYDRDLNRLRDVTYNDFVILMDKATNFNLYKKIFEYLMIPLTKYTKTSITTEVDTFILKNILGLIIKTKSNEFDEVFKYYFTSVARSYLFRYSDQEIFDIINNNRFSSNKIMTSINEIVKDIDALTNREIFAYIIDKFDMYYKHITVGDLMNATIRLDALEDMLDELSNMGNTIYEAFSYLDTMIKDEYKLESISVDNAGDSVKIMTIHASKGLEYSICYFSGLYSKFNIRELNEKILYNDKYGIIVPYFKEGIGSTICKQLARNSYISEEISEKIRLFYVALTRAREKIVIVIPAAKEDNAVDVMNAKSFMDFLSYVNNNIIESITEVDISSLNLTDKYKQIREYNYKDSISKSSEKIIKRDIKIDNYEVVEGKYSKVNKGLFDDETIDAMDIGTKIHHILEMIDFKNPNLDILDDDIRIKVNNFLNSGIDFFNATIYKEYEFIHNEEENTLHGIMDLILEYDDEIKIIDYKLSNIEDNKYVEQLNGYKRYMETKTNKKVSLYLYSIFKGELKYISC